LDPHDEETVGSLADREADAVPGCERDAVENRLRLHVEGHELHDAHREGRHGLVTDQDCGLPGPGLEDGSEPVNPLFGIDRTVGPPDTEGEASEEDDEESDDFPAAAGSDRLINRRGVRMSGD